MKDCRICLELDEFYRALGEALGEVAVSERRNAAMLQTLADRVRVMGLRVADDSLRAAAERTAATGTPPSCQNRNIPPDAPSLADKPLVNPASSVKNSWDRWSRVVEAFNRQANEGIFRAEEWPDSQPVRANATKFQESRDGPMLLIAGQIEAFIVPGKPIIEGWARVYRPQNGRRAKEDLAEAYEMTAGTTLRLDRPAIVRRDGGRWSLFEKGALAGLDQVR